MMLQLTFNNDNKIHSNNNTAIASFQNGGFDDDPLSGKSSRLASRASDEQSFRAMKDILDNPLKNKMMTILKMLTVILLPMLTLLSVVIYDLVIAIERQNVAQYTIGVIADLESLNDFVYDLQKEGGMTAGTFETRQSIQTLLVLRAKTDKSFSRLSIWPPEFIVDGNDVSNPKAFTIFLDSFRESLDEIIQSNLTGTFDASYNAFLTYTDINSALISFAGSLIEVPAVQGIWKTPVTNNFLTQIAEYYGQVRALGLLFYSWCYLTPEAYTGLCSANGTTQNLLQRVYYLKDGLKMKIAVMMRNSSNIAMLPSMWATIDRNLIDSQECMNLTTVLKKQAQNVWFSAFTDVIDVIFSIRNALVGEFNVQLQSFSGEMRTRTIIYVLILLLTNIVSSCLLAWFSSRLSRLLGKLAGFAGLIRSKSRELADERRKASALLHKMLPAEVVEQLMSKQEVPPKHYEKVTVYFSDIVKFTEISGKSSPLQIVNMLNALYSGFDELIERYQVYKVETIGDAYMVAAGVPKVIGMPAREMALLSFDLLAFAKGFRIDHLPGQELLLRIGMHSGSVVAGVVGVKMPRYCLFGDTVNTASRMESHGEAKRIHISGSTKAELEGCEDFRLVERGLMEIKGKGQMLTYWLEK